jgi:hypothetical protein
MDLIPIIQTGRGKQLNHIFCRETDLCGWTLGGKLRVVKQIQLPFPAISLLVKQKHSDMWNLESIGITDSAEQVSNRNMMPM